MSETHSESIIWKGHSSHWANVGVYVVCGLLFFLIVPLVILVKRWLELHYRVYELSSERLHVTTGIFSRVTNSLELYRVRDISVYRPLLLRLSGLGTVVLETTDETTPRLAVEAVRDPFALRDQIRTHVERCRLAKGVRQLDVQDTLVDSPHPDAQ